MIFFHIVDDSGAAASVHPATDLNNVEENCSDAAGLKKDEKNVPEDSDIAPSSTANIVSLEDVFTNSSAGSFSDTSRNKLAEDASCSMRISEAEVTHIETRPPAISTTSTVSRPVKKETSKKVAFVAVKKPAPSTTDQSRFPLKGTERNSNDLFFNLLTGGNQSSLL